MILNLENVEKNRKRRGGGDSLLLSGQNRLKSGEITVRNWYDCHYNLINHIGNNRIDYSMHRERA